MKHIIFLLLLCSSLFCSAQTDSISVTLSQGKHAWIMSFCDRNNVEEQKYYNDIVKATKLPIDTAQRITVKVTRLLIRRLYEAVGSKPERLANQYNTAIKNDLTAQFFQAGDMQTLLLLKEVTDRNVDETEQIIEQTQNNIRVLK